MKIVCMLVFITGMIHAGEVSFSTETYKKRPDVKSSERGAGRQAPYEPEAAKEKFDKSYAQYSSALYQTEVLDKNIQEQKSLKSNLTRTEKKELAAQRDAKKQTRILTSSDYQKLAISDVPSAMNEIKFSAFTWHTPAGGPYDYVIGSDVLALGKYIDGLQDVSLKQKFATLSDAKNSFYQSVALCDSLGLKQYFNDQGELISAKIQEKPLTQLQQQSVMNSAQQMSALYDKLLALYDEQVLSASLPKSVVKERLATLDQMYKSQFPDGVTTILGAIKQSAIDACIKKADQIQSYLQRQKTTWEPSTTFAQAIPQMNQLIDYLLVSEQALGEATNSNRLPLEKAYTTFKTAIILLDQDVAKNFSDRPWRKAESLSQMLAVDRIDGLANDKNVKSSDKAAYKGDLLITTGYDLLRHALGEQLTAMQKLMQ
jgi:hypothetical protein